MGYISRSELCRQTNAMKQNQYGRYLQSILDEEWESRGLSLVAR
jgi:hypothetical protein